ncbi:MAG: hypothetical protein KIT22_02005 [Verrucomicrobiae bacterium]|nr:hypothetical protein [Verrucomicrobiae bacterium]
MVGALAGSMFTPPRTLLCVPQNSEPLLIAEEGSEAPGRAALELDLIVRGGEVLMPAGPGPIF